MQNAQLIDGPSIARFLRMSPLAPGLLVAAPPLGDPNFDRSVVLLAAHGPEGAFGWVINGRELMSLSDLLVRAEVTATPPEVHGVVRVGGPVSQEQIWLVYKNEDRFADIEGQFDVGPTILATASRRVLEALGEGRHHSNVIGLAGYAGWAPSQLENEIRHGAWLPTEIDPSVLFEVPTEEVWQQAYRLVGTTPMAFTTRTVGLA